jgi:hypothetical protein
MRNDTLDRAKAAVARSSLPALAFSLFFPRDLRLVGPDVDGQIVRGYLGRAAELTEAACASVAVMGERLVAQCAGGLGPDPGRGTTADGVLLGGGRFRGYRCRHRYRTAEPHS